MSDLHQLRLAIMTLRAIDPEMPLQRVQLILEIALAGSDEISQAHLANVTGIAKASVSRNLSMLTVEGDEDTKRPGYNIIERFEIPDGRRRGIRLTLNGRRVVNQLRKDLGYKPR